MLNISDLKVTVDGKAILNGLNLAVGPGEVHAIMGPNGSGKSTLANVIAGRDDYEVTGGSVSFMENDLLSMAPEERAHKGVFLAFQYPVEIPGVANIALLKEGLNAARRHRGGRRLRVDPGRRRRVVRAAAQQRNQQLGRVHRRRRLRRLRPWQLPHPEFPHHRCVVRVSRERRQLCIEVSRRSGGQGCAPAAVFINDVPVPYPEQAIIDMDPNFIDRIEVLNPVDASFRFGTIAGNGAIVIYTR